MTVNEMNGKMERLENEVKVRVILANPNKFIYSNSKIVFVTEDQRTWITLVKVLKSKNQELESIVEMKEIEESVYMKILEFEKLKFF